MPTILELQQHAIPFTGKAHQALLNEIVNEIEQADRSYHANWLLWGPGGAGKTRLVVEIAKQLNNWSVIFVEGSPTPAYYKRVADTLRNPIRPTLFVIDDADQYPKNYLEALAHEQSQTWGNRKHPAVLLCIARVNPKDPNHVCNALNCRLAPKRIRMVPPIDDRADQLAILNHARIAPDWDVPEDLPTTPLTLIAMALAEQADINTLNDLWGHWQRSAWRRIIANQGGEAFCQDEAAWSEIADAIEQALLAATLGCAFNAPEDVAQWWEKNLRWKMDNPPNLQWLAYRLLHLFPRLGNEWQLPAIEPPLLAGLILRCQLAERPELHDIISTSLPQDAAAVNLQRILAAFDNMHKYLESRSLAWVRGCIHGQGQG